jgi:hypothetical protein
LGLTEGPWRVDLTVIGERVAYSASQTNGWTMLDKPIALTKVDLDADLRLRTMLGLTWNF